MIYTYTRLTISRESIDLFYMSKREKVCPPASIITK